MGIVLVSRSVLLYRSGGKREANMQDATETTHHIPEVRVHGSKVTQNVNLSLCTSVCVLMFSLGGFCGICVWEPEWICVCFGNVNQV